MKIWTLGIYARMREHSHKNEMFMTMFEHRYVIIEFKTYRDTEIFIIVFCDNKLL